MSNLSPAAKIAIAFIRPFRSYLDGISLIKGKRKSLEKSMEQKTNYIVDSLNSNNGAVDETMIKLQKDLLRKMNSFILDKYEKSYDSILPTIIDELTINIEKQLTNSYTNQELIELEKLVNNPLMDKLMGNKMLFGLLKECEINMDITLQSQVMESMMSIDKDKLLDMLDEYNSEFFNKKNDKFLDYYVDEDENEDFEDDWNRDDR